MTDGSIDRARALLAAHPVIDGHNDLAWELRKRVRYDFDRLDIARPQPEVHTDIPRLRAGGVGAQLELGLVSPDSRESRDEQGTVHE